MPPCSVIVPVHNRAALTRQCLDALVDPRAPLDAEIIVVDDGSTDETPAVLGTYGGRVRVITLTSNAGFARACNAGAAAAAGEYLVFLNNDTIPQQGWLDALVRHANAHGHAAVVGAKLLYPNDTIQHAGVVICQDRYPRHVYAGFPADHPAVNKSRPFQIVTAGCMLVRRPAFEQADGFDAAFHNGYEDVDLCLRLGTLGHEIHYCHESVLYHLESVSRGFRNAAGVRLYESRWAGRVRPDDVDYYLTDGLLNVEYAESYPITVTASPLLSAPRDTDGNLERWTLLQLRSRQVFHLLRETVNLLARVVAVEFPGHTARFRSWTDAQTDAVAESVAPENPPDDLDRLRTLLVDAHRQLATRDNHLQTRIAELEDAIRTIQRERGSGDELPPAPYFAYEQLVDRVRAAVESAVPQRGQAIVVSKGDGQLLQLGGRPAVHFPQADDGTYAGAHPPDSQSAIAQLEALRAKGGEFLVIPKTSFWWLEHYVDFRQHLEARYRVVVHEPDTCLIMALR